MPGGKGKIKASDGKPFKKGFDPRRNMEGRPRKIPSLEKLIDEVLGDERDDKVAIKEILKAVRNKALKGNIEAAKICLNRAYGKEEQNVNLKGDLGIEWNETKTYDSNKDSD